MHVQKLENRRLGKSWDDLFETMGWDNVLVRTSLGAAKIQRNDRSGRLDQFAQKRKVGWTNPVIRYSKMDHWRLHSQDIQNKIDAFWRESAIGKVEVRYLPIGDQKLVDSSESLHRKGDIWEVESLVDTFLFDLIFEVNQLEVSFLVIRVRRVQGVVKNSDLVIWKSWDLIVRLCFYRQLSNSLDDFGCNRIRDRRPNIRYGPVWTCCLSSTFHGWHEHLPDRVPKNTLRVLLLMREFRGQQVIQISWIPRLFSFVVISLNPWEKSLFRRGDDQFVWKSFLPSDPRFNLYRCLFCRREDSVIEASSHGLPLTRLKCRVLLSAYSCKSLSKVDWNLIFGYVEEVLILDVTGAKLSFLLSILLVLISGELFHFWLLCASSLLLRSSKGFLDVFFHLWIFLHQAWLLPYLDWLEFWLVNDFSSLLRFIPSRFLPGENKLDQLHCLSNGLLFNFIHWDFTPHIVINRDSTGMGINCLGINVWSDLRLNGRLSPIIRLSRCLKAMVLWNSYIPSFPSWAAYIRCLLSGWRTGRLK